MFEWFKQMCRSSSPSTELKEEACTSHYFQPIGKHHIGDIWEVSMDNGSEFDRPESKCAEVLLPQRNWKKKLALATTQPIGSGRLVIFFSNQSPLLVAPSSLSPFETAHNILLPLASGHPSPTLVILHLPVESLITPAMLGLGTKLWTKRAMMSPKSTIQNVHIFLESLQLPPFFKIMHFTICTPLSSYSTNWDIFSEVAYQANTVVQKYLITRFLTFNKCQPVPFLAPRSS